MAERDPTTGQYLPGHIGNQHGRGKLPPELAKIKSVTHQELSKIISKYLQMDQVEIVAASQDKSLSMLHLIILKLIAKTLDTADERTFESLRHWCMGKAKDDLEPTSRLSNKEVMEALNDTPKATLADYLREKSKLNAR